MSKRPKRPYLLRALYDWIVDSELTPYLLVNALADDVAVPADFVNDGKIVLNVAPHAVRDLAIDDSAVACHCRFGGKPFAVYLPMRSIEAIYAKETGEGMAFEAEHFPDPGNEPPPGGGDDKAAGSHLKVVK
ncbi:MAG: ClpXP protease specificity-enhancing factor [Pseudomonadales bacterium]